MAISFGIKLTWEQFWDDQQNNPNCELAFLLNGRVYYLYYDSLQKRGWGIYEAGKNSECRGINAFGKCLTPLSNEIHRSYKHKQPNQEDWQTFIDSCYKVLTAPIWDGKSFKESIDDILFES